MKRMISKVIAIVFFCSVTVLVIYCGFIQRWTGSVTLNESDIEKFNCLEAIKVNEAKAFFYKVFEESDGENKDYESTWFKTKVYKDNNFTREIEFYEQDNQLQFRYTFEESPYSVVHVYISLKNANKLNLSEYNSIEELKSKLSKDIGKNRFIYDSFTKEGNLSNVNYFVTPVTTPSRKSCFYIFATNRNERHISSVYEIGQFVISIEENINFNNESKYSLILKDVANLLQKTGTEKSVDGSVC